MIYLAHRSCRACRQMTAMVDERIRSTRGQSHPRGLPQTDGRQVLMSLMLRPSARRV